MRGTDRQTGHMFSYLSPEALVPKEHPLRLIRPLANAALERPSASFHQMYSAIGRPSIPPEQLLRALLVQAFFSVRSERQLIEQLTYNMMFRWFVGLSMDAPVWDVTVFTKNRDRLLEGDGRGTRARSHFVTCRDHVGVGFLDRRSGETMQVLTDAEWENFTVAIATAQIRGARPRVEDRRIIEAIHWRIGNGAK